MLRRDAGGAARGRPPGGVLPLHRVPRLPDVQGLGPPRGGAGQGGPPGHGPRERGRATWAGELRPGGDPTGRSRGAAVGVVGPSPWAPGATAAGGGDGLAGVGSGVPLGAGSSYETDDRELQLGDGGDEPASADAFGGAHPGSGPRMAVEHAPRGAGVSDGAHPGSVPPEARLDGAPGEPSGAHPFAAPGQPLWGGPADTGQPMAAVDPYASRQPVPPAMRQPIAGGAPVRDAGRGDRARGAERAHPDERPHDAAAPSWERPRRFEAYPSLRTRSARLRPWVLPLVVLILVGAGAFIVPGLIRGLGGGGTDAPTASAQARASASPTASARPTQAPSPDAVRVRREGERHALADRQEVQRHGPADHRCKSEHQEPGPDHPRRPAGDPPPRVVGDRRLGEPDAEGLQEALRPAPAPKS